MDLLSIGVSRGKQIPRFGMTTAMAIPTESNRRMIVRRGEVREWVKRSASKAGTKLQSQRK